MPTASSYTALVNDLPAEVVQLIFSLLKLDQLVRCLRVCKEWRRILTSLPWLWRHVNLSVQCWQSNVVPETYARALTHLVQLAGDHLQWLKLDIELSEALGIQALQLIASNGCYYLKGLELNNTSGPEERLLLLRALYNIGPMTTMTFLQLYCLEINLTDVAHLFDQFPNLTHLDLSDSVLYDQNHHSRMSTTTINGNSVQPSSALPCVTRLKSLTLNHIEGSSSFVFHSILQSCPHLDQLCCRGTLPSYQVIQHLNQHQRASIKVLTYGHQHQHQHQQHQRRNIDQETVLHIPPLQLEGLDAVQLEQVNDQDFISMVCYGHAYRTISKMDIRSCFIPDESILSAQQQFNNAINTVAIVSKALWPNLRQLDLNTVSGLTLKTGLFAFLDACPVLEKLTFKNIPWWHVNDTTLDRWTQYPRLLNIQYFGQPDDITSKAVQKLVDTKCSIINKQQKRQQRNFDNALHLEFNTHTRIHIIFPSKS